MRWYNLLLALLVLKAFLNIRDLNSYISNPYVGYKLCILPNFIDLATIAMDFYLKGIYFFFADTGPMCNLRNIRYVKLRLCNQRELYVLRFVFLIFV